MGWLISAVALTLLLSIPLRLLAKYDPSGAVVSVKIGPKSFMLYPRNRAKMKNRNNNQAINRKERSAANQDDANKIGSFSELMPMIHIVLELLNDVRKKIRVDYLEFRLILGDDDPSDLGMNFGKAWAIIGNVLPQLERVFQIKKRNIDVSSDFTSTKTMVFARADVSITLGRGLCLAVVYGIKVLKQRYKLMNQRKGGAKI